MDRPGVRLVLTAVVGWLYVASLWLVTSFPRVPGTTGHIRSIATVVCVLAFALGALVLVKRLNPGRFWTGLVLFVVLTAVVHLADRWTGGGLRALAERSRGPWPMVFWLLTTQLDLLAVLCLPLVIAVLFIRPRASEIVRSPGWIAIVIGLAVLLMVVACVGWSYLWLFRQSQTVNGS